MVLFLFVIMLVNLDQAAKERQFNRQWVIALITSILLIGELGFVVWKGADTIVAAEGQPATSVLGVTGNSQLVGETLYGQYLLPFEIASILLLVAIVGSVALSKRKTQAE
jgi:NADH-quinone oxidoreductase subunit J